MLRGVHVDPTGLHGPWTASDLSSQTLEFYPTFGVAPVYDVWLNGSFHKTRHFVPLNALIPTAFNELQKIKHAGNVYA